MDATVSKLVLCGTHFYLSGGVHSSIPILKNSILYSTKRAVKTLIGKGYTFDTLIGYIEGCTKVKVRLETDPFMRYVQHMFQELTPHG
jgi:hypothetical protein